MSSSLVLKRLASSSLLTRSLRTISPTATCASRFISTKAVEDFLSGLYDPFWSRNWVPYLKDQITNNKVIHTTETHDELSYRVEMPGLGKEDVKVYIAKQNTLVIKGKKEGVCEEYNYSIGIHKECIGGIKAVMQKGVLEVLVPKLGPWDRETLHDVDVQSDMKMTDEALYIRMDHTLLDKKGLRVEDVKLSVEQNTLIVKTRIVNIEGAKRDLTSMLDLPKSKKKYNNDEIKAKIKNNLLMAVIPLVNDKESIEV